MDELSTALRELARDAAPTPVDPASLWHAGRARVRRRRVAGAAVVAVVAVLVGSLAWVRSEPVVVMPAGEVHRAAIPRNVYQPGGWIAGVSDAGPPGPLAVIARDEGDSDGRGDWFGISATTGAYRYLDLPHIAADSDMKLSPGGTRIAYWVTGPTEKDDFGPGDGVNVGGPVPDRPATGIGVYDTRDGTLVRHMVPSTYGLDVDSGGIGGLAWLGDDSLVFGFGKYVGSNTSNDDQVYRWVPGPAEPTRLPGADISSAAYGPLEPGRTSLRFADSEDGPNLVEVGDDAVPTGRTFNVPGAWIGAFGVRAGRIATTGTTTNRNDGNVQVGRLRTGPTSLHRVSELTSAQFLGWLSDHTVLVTAWPGETRDGQVQAELDGVDASDRALYVVDVDSGRAERVGQVDDDLVDVDLQVARSLLAEPLVAGRKPPGLLESFGTELVIVSGLAGASVAAWLLVRRRRRAQG